MMYKIYIYEIKEYPLEQVKAWWHEYWITYVSYTIYIYLIHKIDYTYIYMQFIEASLAHKKKNLKSLQSDNVFLFFTFVTIECL